MTARPRKPSNAQRVLEHLLAIAPREATLVQIRNALFPGADPNRISGTVNTLANRGGISRTQRRGHTYYAAIEGVDSVPLTPEGMALSRKKRAPLGGGAQAANARTAGTAPTGANTPAHTCPQRQASDRITADIAEFQRRGGQIERLGTTPLRPWRSAYN